MITVVEQSLGHIHSGYTRTLILQAVEHELMTAQAIDRELVDILQTLLDIVGVEHCQRTDFLNMLTS